MTDFDTNNDTPVSNDAATDTTTFDTETAQGTPEYFERLKGLVQESGRMAEPEAEPMAPAPKRRILRRKLWAMRKEMRRNFNVVSIQQRTLTENQRILRRKLWATRKEARAVAKLGEEQRTLMTKALLRIEDKLDKLAAAAAEQRKQLSPPTQNEVMALCGRIADLLMTDSSSGKSTMVADDKHFLKSIVDFALSRGFLSRKQMAAAQTTMERVKPGSTKPLTADAAADDFLNQLLGLFK